MQRIAAVLFTLFSTSLFAQPQDGSMTYAPAAAPAPTPVEMVQAVPIPALFLIPLGLILAIVGIRAVKKHGSAVLGALLAITGTLAVVSGAMVVQDAVAIIAETELSDPSGAVIIVPEGLHQYRNTSGVQLEITEITPPCPVSNTASNACVVGGETAINGICNTEYICTPPQQPELCSETCIFSNDSDCDDGGPGSDFSACSLGTDCTDCGVRCPTGLISDINNPGFCTFPSG